MSAVKRMYEQVSEEMGLGGEITDAVIERVRANVGSVPKRRTTMKCEDCEAPIPAERLEALPDTKKCVECARKRPADVFIDPDEVCAQPSISARNGFAKGD